MPHDLTNDLFDGSFDPEPDPRYCRICQRPASAEGLCAWCLKSQRGTSGHSDPHFDGETYDPAKDHLRLTGLLASVRTHMLFGEWQTLEEIHTAIGGQGTEASISARLRDLRKTKFGAYTVERRRRLVGLWEYRLLVPGQVGA